MKYLKKFIRLLSTISCILLVVYVLVNLPEAFGYHKLIIKNDDMKSVYSNGTVIYYYETKNIQVGDYITYKENADLKVGRIHRIQDSKYVVRFDNNSEEHLELKDIVGKNLNIILLFLGPYVTFVNNNLILFIVTCLIFIILNIILSNMKEKEPKKVLKIDE